MSASKDSAALSSSQRVLRALDFQRPDRVPLHDSFWLEFVAAWRAEKGLPADADISDYYGLDVRVVAPDETPFPSQAAVLKQDGDREVSRTGWGVVQRRRLSGKFFETVQVPLADKARADRLAFESPLLDCRYAPAEQVEVLKGRYCAFVKTGGPYLRTSNLRGTAQWLIDLVEDEPFALELAMRVTRHIAAVGLEAIRRYGLFHTGIWFYDDMGCNLGPMFSPRVFERVFLPCYQWMCAQYRATRVAHILLHCDGNIEPILDMLVGAGIQGLHPVEPKAGMDAVKLRGRYGTSLALLGGLDNARVIPRGSRRELEAHVRHVLEAGTEGGLVIGTHSIGPDVSVARYDLLHRLIRESGTYA